MVANPSADKPRKKKVGERGPEISILTRLQARNMYLNERLPYNVISEKTGIPVRSLHAMACREGWTVVRREQKKRLIEKSDARGAAMQNEVIDAIASASEQHAIRGLQRVGEALERDDRDAAKDAQAYSATVKNLASVAKIMREPTGSADAGPSSFNFFFMPAAPAAQPGAEAKPVTEIVETPSDSGIS